jgi:Susd and RagB outer membrane lipoprotein
MIGTQMWLSKWLNWWDAWADWRRTGFPVLTEINYPGNITNGKIPTKLRYPSHEVATNSANIDAGGTENVPTAKVWWDKN